MRFRNAIFTASVVLAWSCPVWSQEAPKDTTSVDTAAEDLKSHYLTEAKKRVELLVDAFKAKAEKLTEFETDITNAEKVISEAIVVWNALKQNLKTETDKVTENLIAPKSVNGAITSSARDTLVQSLRDAIVQLEKEKPYRLSADETSSLQHPEKPLPVRAVADDADRLRWLEQQLLVAERIIKDAVPSIPANANERPSESLAFIKEHLGVEKMSEKDQQPILEALKTLQPAESK